MIKKTFLSAAACVLSVHLCFAQVSIKNDPQVHTVKFSNNKLQFILNYDHQCRVSEMEVNGQKVISESHGIYSEIATGGKTFSTLSLKASPQVKISGNTLQINAINYGDNAVSIHETWKFIISDTGVTFNITRNCPKAFDAESVSFPAIEFHNINTWEAAFQGFGGIAWFYLFNEKLCTYGVHTNEAAFWNSKTNNGLNISLN
ncbi:MAG: hypothetical protein M3R50_07535, partial [Bacteroidota bacterium]|nr:hypothetical protein [Bacteroidota bacterium]